MKQPCSTTFEEIICNVGYNKQELLSSCRTRRLANQRKIVASLLIGLNYSRKEIGSVMNRHPSSITAMWKSYV